MWRENNTREFEKLEIDWNDKIDLFPNSHFGFNGRQLLTTAVQVNEVHNTVLIVKYLKICCYCNIDHFLFHCLSIKVMWS